MSAPTALPAFDAIIVAAGKGLRAGQELPKQFALWRGKPVLQHSLEAFAEAGAQRIVIAIPDGTEEIVAEIAHGIDAAEWVTGGATRQLSVRAALERLADRPSPHVLIHDAARADLPLTVIDRLRNALARNKGAIPVLPVVDSLAVAEGDLMSGAAPREQLRRVQTPQAFHSDAILAAHRAWAGEADAGDDAQVLHAAGHNVSLVLGDEALKKLTFAEDFMSDIPMVRTGMGFDVHRLAPSEELWLGGIQIEHTHGLAGHSDADVALHAIVDALLGAIAEGDIGTHFPPNDPQWKGASSDQFLAHAGELVTRAGFAISNLDLTIICEAPKIGLHRPAMRERIAEILSIDIGKVSVKATTTERLGLTGRGEGIAAQAVATLMQTGFGQ
ncbi:bifunctional 2-C-methyl-D-erythritol 4-phosphate cytidylyltransferase/2-C-methyl-D-erythritol 2,4-cyclodiphosphate synthase [Qipengyuania sp. DGS5-3]|uniref:bifunctional 2-C-methyl-D-erythritol 4-phosphate cytidylyltransferase/2-C-methyl-D-erythritol 2,4-cyclodiphosphate synthase n=1 Tax=Qipengyuania sp. DGS5-3 TaxID=3349632 RepID=UPI0036D39A6B